ncbi:alpha/beta hydrolase [Salisediminibacterium beveridgei]|nr:alpha/beta hydrolase [Salisediminibacterium beveridgei]
MQQLQGSKLNGYDNQPLFVYQWTAIPSPKALVLIAHGMAEHGGRYEAFASYLNKQGYAVAASDHRGHGRTAGADHLLGQIGSDGFHKIVEDQRVLVETFKTRFPDTPVILLGHSFGSFITQEFMIRYGRLIDGVILSGTTVNAGIDVCLGAKLAAIQERLFGGEKPAALLDKVAFSGNNDGFDDADLSDAAWLSRDTEAVRSYDADPYCGTLFPIVFYKELFTSLPKLVEPERLRMVPKSLPVLLISGDRDPVGKNGTGVITLKRMYDQLGLTDVTMTLYPNGRHEMLNEINRREVFDDVRNWLETILSEEEALR